MGTSLSWQTDAQIVDAVQRRLDAEPDLDWRDVALKASEGVVSLTGFVHSFADKMAAEQAATNVRGVRGVANDIHVTPRDERSDPEIAKDAVHELRSQATAPHVTVTVRDGVITLEGTVELMHQRLAAEMAMRHVPGVRAVSNAILVDGLTPVNIHAYSFKAGKHTLNLGKGACLLVGFMNGNQEVPIFDAGLAGNKKNIDWLFE